MVDSTRRWTARDGGQHGQDQVAAEPPSWLAHTDQVTKMADFAQCPATGPDGMPGRIIGLPLIL
jgi:hypothetical protein